MNEINNNHETEEIQYERLDPKNDFLFKKLFSSAGNEDLLIDLINSILKPPKQQRICQVTVTNPIKERDFADDKLSVMDIVARVDDGRQVTIEIQVTNEYDMEKRALYYWSSIFTSQMHIGMSYEELKKTISINILDYRLWQQTKRHHTIFRLLEESEGFLLTDAAEIHFLELRKMYRKWKAEKFKGSTDPLYRWFLLLMATEDEKISQELEEIALSDSIINKAIGEWERLSQDPETRALYRSRMLAKIDQLSALKNAERKGREEGREEGREKGKAEGREEGKIEGKMETVRMALQAGVSLEMIAKITGLDQATILKLKEEQ
jgi:predicted transposase/invertase (TIGR01784 family)